MIMGVQNYIYYKLPIIIRECSIWSFLKYYSLISCTDKKVNVFNTCMCSFYQDKFSLVLIFWLKAILHMQGAGRPDYFYLSFNHNPENSSLLQKSPIKSYAFLFSLCNIIMLNSASFMSIKCADKPTWYMYLA